jgi:hypothetical protein
MDSNQKKKKEAEEKEARIQRIVEIGLRIMHRFKAAPKKRQ